MLCSGCTSYTCYSGFISTSCCDFCPVCRRNQVIFVVNDRHEGDTAAFLNKYYPAGSLFFCYNRPSDGVVALPGEIDVARALTISGAVLFGLSLLIFPWVIIIFCTANRSCCFEYKSQDHEIAAKFKHSEVSLRQRLEGTMPPSSSAPVASQIARDEVVSVPPAYEMKG